MTRGEARALNSPTIKIGSHTLTHSSLPHLASDEKLSEIRDSAVLCEAITGECPRDFAYPYGEFDEESEAMVAQSGFYCACTTEEGGVYSAARRTALPRLGVGNWPPEQFGRLLFEL
jgi:peptidoglycan/xylan/chitin deacetylase (PgdA/CDA1 family)